MPHALIVDDDKLTLRYLDRLVQEEGFSTDTAASLRKGKDCLRQRCPDLLLVDLFLPDGRGLDLLAGLEARSSLEVVVITAHASVDTAVQALHLGASDYLTKPIDDQRLKAILKNVLRIRNLKEEIGDLHSRLRKFGSFGNLIGASPAMQEVYDLISKVAPTDATVFVSGESGCGKEVVARTIHEFSPRRGDPFLALNCGAISPSLIESELFGHEPGSFTGATALRRGDFERAHGGTLLLDEIAEMPADLQVKLLRVLEAGALQRVGGDRQIDVDVRVIAATNRPPAKAVADGRLRADLYYRLNVFSIELPPLRERLQDVDLLAANFLSELNRANGAAKRISPEAVGLLRRYPWPGNVRELKNVIRRAFILAADEILPACLPAELQDRAIEPHERTIHFEVGTPLAEIERRAILETYRHCAGNKKRTAKTLGINLRTLYNRLHSYEACEASDNDGHSAKRHQQ